MNEMRKLMEASAQLFAEQNKRPGAYESSLTASDVAHLVRLKTTDSVETLSKLKASFDQLKKALRLYDIALSQFHAVYEPQSIDLDDTSGNAYEDLAKIEAELRSAGLMESAMVKEENPKGPPQQGTREYDQMHQALSQLGRLRHDAAYIYRQWPNSDADTMLAELIYIQKRLQQPLRILDRMEIDQSGWEFRVQNKSWSILATGDESTFRKVINSKEVGPERIRNMIKAMDRDLTDLVNKLSSFANAQRFID